MRPRWWLRSLLTAALVVGVLSARAADAAGGLETLVGGGRPAVVALPPHHDPARPAPLLVVLHGYASDAEKIERTFPLAAAAARAGVLVVRPEGTEDAFGQRFWNAATACCGQFGADVDDEAYLLRLLDEIEAAVAVDRVVLFGHSNGGFMAYRLACRHGARFAAVVTLAGGLDDPPPACAEAPPRVLHVHGTADPAVAYDGGALFGAPPYTGAEATVAAFAAASGCGAFAVGAPFDLDLAVQRAETVPSEAACPAGRRVTLWRVAGGGHEPAVGAGFAGRVLGYALGR